MVNQTGRWLACLRPTIANSRSLVLHGLAWEASPFATVLLALVQLPQGDAEGGFWGGFVFVMVLLVLGAIQTVNGLALLRRNPVARPLLAITSLVLLVPSVLAVFPLLVVLPSLWVTLSTGGKEAFESYTPRENG